MTSIIRVAFEWLFRLSASFLRATVESSGEISTSCSFKRENIDIRGGFFSSSAPRSPNESVASGPEHADRNSNGEHGDVSASSKIREKPIRRGSASGCS